MVLESLFNIESLRKRPVMIIFQTFILVSISLWVGFALFPEQASIAAIGLTTIGLMPIMQKVLEKEEEEEEKTKESSFSFAARHFDIVALFSWMFLGMILAYFAWFAILPADSQGCMDCTFPTKDKVFSEQAKTINFIKANIALPAQPAKSDCFGTGKNVSGCTQYIFSNNAIVLGLSIILSFLFGAGAIFILAWNASIIGIILGEQALKLQGLHWGLISGIGLIPHGLPEIGSYFLGAIAGGIISAAIIRGKYNTAAFEQVAKDVLILIVASYIILFAAALIEGMTIVGA